MKFQRLFLSAVVLVSITLSGCAPHGVDLVKTGGVNVVLPPEKQFALGEPHVYAKDGEMSVIGDIVAVNDRHAFDPGHVHVTVRSPDGQVIAEKNQKVTVQRNGNRHTSRRYMGSYSVRFDLVPPKGAAVQVTHCHDEHPENETRGA